MPIPDLLRELLLASGASGHEEPASRVWREAAAEFATVTSDAMGTSFARVEAGGHATLALLGHIDEIGVAITHIDSGGLLSFSLLGSMEAEMLAGQRVVIAGREGSVDGVIVPRMISHSERRERSGLRLSDLHIDIGAVDGEEADARVALGAPGVWKGDPIELPNGRIASKSLDNRVGAYVVLEAARRIAASGGSKVDVVAVATVQEELAHQGARTAAFTLEPEFALAVDVTWTTDVPGGNPRRAGRIDLGSGAAITLGPVINRNVSNLLGKVAEEEKIPHAFEVWPGRTSTDADDVHVSRGGVPTGLVSVPVRYMHSPCEIASLDDLESAIRLVVAFAARLTPETTFVR
ncbi:MAG TPA: hypothetical protein VGM80_17590 [Gaiellaceae bacterium]